VDKQIKKVYSIVSKYYLYATLYKKIKRKKIGIKSYVLILETPNVFAFKLSYAHIAQNKVEMAITITIC
jgi:hypothetical protein